MAKLFPARGVQYPVSAEFIFNWNDYVYDSVSGLPVTMGSTAALADPSSAVSGLTGAAANTVTVDCFPMPTGAQITGGDIVVETAYAGSTAVTASLGIAGTLTGLLNAVDCKTVGRTALTLTTPLVANNGTNLRLTFAYTVANATAGRVRLHVTYKLDGKVNEAAPV